MIIHNHYDALLTATITTGEAGSEAQESNIIDLTETGGVEHAQIVITAPAADQELTIKILAADDKDGEFAEALSFTTTANEEMDYRERIPLHIPQYIKLQVTTGDTAPSEPAAVTLRVAC